MRVVSAGVRQLRNGSFLGVSWIEWPKETAKRLIAEDRKRGHCIWGSATDVFLQPLVDHTHRIAERYQAILNKPQSECRRTLEMIRNKQGPWADSWTRVIK